MTSELLPDAPGYVHGIVRTEDGVLAIQCDGCGRLDTHKSLDIVKRRAAVDPLVSLVKARPRPGHLDLMSHDLRATSTPT